MRKIYLIVVILFTIKFIYAQDKLVIKSPIELMQGYILFQDNLNIDYWEVQIINRVKNSDNTFTKVKDRVYDVVGKNYFKIPDKFLTISNEYARVIQMNSDGTNNTELQKLNSVRSTQPGGGSEFLGSFICNGSTYAWSIDQTGIKHNNVTCSVFSLNFAYASMEQNTGIPTPYYEYFSPAAFHTIRTQLTDASSPNYHPNINGVWYQEYYWLGNELLTQQYNQAAPYSSPSVIKLQYDPSNIKQDASGADITGVSYVYGIAKGLGPWGGEIIYSTGFYVFTSFQGTQPVQWAIDLINNDSQASPSNFNRPSLSCSSLGGGSIEPKPVDVPMYVLKDYRRKVLDTNSIATNWGFFYAINTLFGDNSDNWWDKYYAISLTKISGNSNEIINAKISNFFD